MRVIFLNRFYWPDEPATGQLLTDLAEGLAAAGHQITVITSRAGSTLPREMHQDVEIHRVRGTRWSRAGILTKAIDHGSYLVSALIRLGRIASRDTIIVAMTDPPLLGIGAWLVARLRHARVLHWVQDIYPEIAIAVTGHRWLAGLRPLRNLAWRHSDGCVTLGTDMASVLRAAGVDPGTLHVIPNPAPAGLAFQADPADSTLRREWDLVGKFVVAYSGNLGRVHDVESILAVAARLHEEPRIAFLFVGDGPQRPSLEQAAKVRRLENVRFFPPQPRGRLDATLGLADLHLVTLRAGCERYVYPSKFQGALAVGRPVLFLGPPACEIASLVRENGLGGAFAPDDAGTIASFILSLARDPAALATLAAAVRRHVAALPSPEARQLAWQHAMAGATP